MLKIEVNYVRYLAIMGINQYKSAVVINFYWSVMTHASHVSCHRFSPSVSLISRYVVKAVGGLAQKTGFDSLVSHHSLRSLVPPPSYPH